MNLDFVILSIAGLAGGFVGAQVGSGAMVTLPALLFLGLPPSIAIGTNILSAWITNVAAAAKYWKSHKTNLRLAIPVAIIATIGTVIGAQLVIDINSALLFKITTFFFLALIALLFIKPKTGLKEEKKHISGRTFVVGSFLVFVLGVYGGFFSVSVTTLFIFLFVLVLGKDFMQAVADSVFVTAIFLVGALVIFIARQNIVYELAIPLAIASAIGSYIGAHTALKLGDRWLKGMLTVILFGVVIKLLLGL